MKRDFKNYQCELSGSMVLIRKDGMMFKAIEVNPWEAVERFQELCVKVKALALSSVK